MIVMQVSLTLSLFHCKTAKDIHYSTALTAWRGGEEGKEEAEEEELAVDHGCK